MTEYFLRGTSYMRLIANLSIDWFELLLILIFQAAAVLLVLAIPTVLRRIRVFLDNNRITVYTWTAVVTFFAIVYRDSLKSLLQPPAYTLYFGIFLALLSWIFANNQKHYEVTTMSTTKDIARVDEKLTDFIDVKLPTVNTQLKEALKEELKEEIKDIVADTVKKTLAAVKADPSILN